jgi:hypothetical protein
LSRLHHGDRQRLIRRILRFTRALLRHANLKPIALREELLRR